MTYLFTAQLSDGSWEILTRLYNNKRQATQAAKNYSQKFERNVSLHIIDMALYNKQAPDRLTNGPIWEELSDMPVAEFGNYETA